MSSKIFIKTPEQINKEIFQTQINNYQENSTNNMFLSFRSQYLYDRDTSNLNINSLTNADKTPSDCIPNSNSTSNIFYPSMDYLYNPNIINVTSAASLIGKDTIAPSQITPLHGIQLSPVINNPEQAGNQATINHHVARLASHDNAELIPTKINDQLTSLQSQVIEHNQVSIATPTTMSKFAPTSESLMNYPSTTNNIILPLTPAIVTLVPNTSLPYDVDTCIHQELTTIPKENNSTPILLSKSTTIPAEFLVNPNTAFQSNLAKEKESITDKIEIHPSNIVIQQSGFSLRYDDKISFSLFM